MADYQQRKKSTTDLLIQYKEFKKDFTMKIDWTNKEWEAEVSPKPKMYYLIKNLSFWYKNLKEVEDTKALVITLYNEVSERAADPRQVLLSFKQKFGIAGLSSFSTTRNRNFLALFFETEAQRNFAANNFCLAEDYIVINSDWYQDSKPLDLKIIWLPPTIDILTIQHNLEEFCEVVSLMRENIDLGDNDTLPTGTITGKIYPNKGTNVKNIPYVMNFLGYNGLIIIYKRQPMCLNCNVVGHIASKCPTPYCNKCRTLKPIIHTCYKREIRKTYSEVASSFLTEEDTLWNNKLVEARDNIVNLERIQAELYKKQEDLPHKAKQIEETKEEKKLTIIDSQYKISNLTTEVQVLEAESPLEDMEVQQSILKRPLEDSTENTANSGLKSLGSKNNTDNKKGNMALRPREGMQNVNKQYKK